VKEIAKAAAKAGQEQEKGVRTNWQRRSRRSTPRFQGLQGRGRRGDPVPGGQGCLPAFDVSTRTTILSTKALEVLKGDLTAGAVKVYIPSTVKPPLSKKWLINVQNWNAARSGSSVREEASETLLLVSRAATRK